MTEFQRTTVEQSVDESLEPTTSTTDARTAGTTTADTAARRTVVWERGGTVATGLTQAARVVALVFGVLQALLIIRVLLLLLGADQANGIVSAVQDFTDPFVAPFKGMFAVSRSNGSILDVAAVAAFVGWTLLEALILAILRIADRRVAVRDGTYEVGSRP